jgi:predicted lipase
MTVIIAFRGTINQPNWHSNVQFSFTDFITENYQIPKVQVHKGFWRAYLEVRGEVLLTIKAMLASYSQLKIFVTGHSLGAALATLCAADIRLSLPISNSNIQVLVYASPRVGNKMFASVYASLGMRTERVTFLGDPVGQIPPRIAGYVHVGTEKYLFRDKFYTCVEADDLECSIGSFPSKISYHTFFAGVKGYFGDDLCT